MVALAAQVRRRPPVHHALVDHELGDIPCRAGGDLGVEPGGRGGLAQGGAAAGKRPQVLVQAQQGGHGGMVDATADSGGMLPTKQAVPANPAHTLTTRSAPVPGPGTTSWVRLAGS